MPDDLNEIEAVNKAAGTYDDVDEVLDRPVDENDGAVALTFGGDASETFANLLQHFTGFGVCLYPEDEDVEPFDAYLVGWNRESDWYTEVVYRKVDEDFEPVGPREVIRVNRIHIH